MKKSLVGMWISLQGLSNQLLRVTLLRQVQDFCTHCRSPSNRDRKPLCSSSKPKRSSRFPRANERPKDKRCWTRNSCTFSFLCPSLQLQTELCGTKDAMRPSNPGDSVNWPLDDKRTRKTSRGTSDPNANTPALGKSPHFPTIGSPILALCQDAPYCNNFGENF